jgi:hypothetical protein
VHCLRVSGDTGVRTNMYVRVDVCAAAEVKNPIKCTGIGVQC